VFAFPMQADFWHEIGAQTRAGGGSPACPTRPSEPYQDKSCPADAPGG
jgi:hypothetical protein